jgi:hypothetical protein
VYSLEVTCVGGLWWGWVPLLFLVFFYFLFFYFLRSCFLFSALLCLDHRHVCICLSRMVCVLGGLAVTQNHDAVQFVFLCSPCLKINLCQIHPSIAVYNCTIESSFLRCLVGNRQHPLRIGANTQPLDFVLHSGHRRWTSSYIQETPAGLRLTFRRHPPGPRLTFRTISVRHIYREDIVLNVERSSD